MEPIPGSAPQSHNKVLDLIVVGGGINGAGIAADAAGRGLNVGLYDAQDFAGATSSASSKLIHGGLRYLEQYEFRLVSEALSEREILLKKAPHLIKSMRLRLPLRPSLRPSWLLRAGLFLYDSLSRRSSLPGSHKVRLPAGTVTKPELTTGFEYSDCWADDARLVLANVMQAKEMGSEVINYCRVVGAKRNGSIWEVELFDERHQRSFNRECRVLVNATGPWVRSFFHDHLHLSSPYGIRLVKGSHIIVPKIHSEPYAYVLQNLDKRLVVVVPYLDKYSMIGTTDVEYQGDPRQVRISDDEKQYLIDVVNQHFVKSICKNDIIHEFSGVRPLLDDEAVTPQRITRDYTLAFDNKDNQAPLLSVFGGKLTTYRKLAEIAMHQLQPCFPHMKPDWTSQAPLPGGEEFNFHRLLRECKQRYPFIGESLLERWLNAYGSRIRSLLAGVCQPEDLGQAFSPSLYQIEVDYLAEHEWVFSAEDLFWRRTKLGLDHDEQTIELVERYLKKRRHRLRTNLKAVS
ncbi:glycerol-3-phosphate dehydrogenase [Vibrio sp. H11]|uniref:glycerol-3-phosphate dehydrogenase n=1 Tax=Vibrio sp. H11 TaxID=2565928 RepID=UPI0010A5FF24|nr:glycerol-3-phosphate dehydrogenase [Vibrio sp. H11]